MRGDQVVVVPNGTYRGGEVNAAHPATSGPLKGWLVLVAVVGFYGLLLYAIIRPYEGAGELAYGDVHV